MYLTARRLHQSPQVSSPENDKLTAEEEEWWQTPSTSRAADERTTMHETGSRLLTEYFPIIKKKKQ